MEIGRRSWLDIIEFEAAVSSLDGRAAEALTPEESRQLQSAVDLYRADLLEEVYDDWCVYERERLRLLALEALQRLMTFHIGRQEWSAAMRSGQRLLAADPLHEPVHRALMRCYSGMGNRGAALRQYQACAQLLEEEFDVQPAADTVSLYEEIRRSEPSAAPEAGSGRDEATSLTHAIRHLQMADRGLRRTRRELRAGTDAVRRALTD
jgi:DNA-binding SARP family transcriptional activator